MIGAEVQGATLMSETLAQYSALMVMEKEYGKEKMRRFLKYELDNYLRNRSGELVEEMPLMLVVKVFFRPLLPVESEFGLSRP